MFMDRFREQMGRAEQRFKGNTKERALRGKEIEKIDDGRLHEVDLSKLDDQGRISRRLAFSALANVGLSTRRSLAAAPVATRSVLLERLIATNELISASFLIEGARVRRTVGRVVIRNSSGGVLGFGTGSMVSPRLMMTNNHVLDSSGTAGNSTIQFDFVELVDGSSLPIVEFELVPSDFFVTNEELDFTFVAVKPHALGGESLASRGWVPLIANDLLTHVCLCV